MTIIRLKCILFAIEKTNQCVRRVALSAIFRDLPVVQGREEDIVNGLTRAGGKPMQVMPDGSLTVMQESSEWMSQRRAYICQTGWYRRSNYNAFVPVEIGAKAFFLLILLSRKQRKRRKLPWKIPKRLYSVACRPQVT